MPDTRQNKNNGISTPANATAHNLDEAMRQNQENHDLENGRCTNYPMRPDEPDCIYFVRTGFCGYGPNCRFNHPPKGFQSRVEELPERVGEPDCQYYLKTGTCKFGALCKYHHPCGDQKPGQVPLNVVGLPMRQEEKLCSYYMRTGSCKFGAACKFNHPQPATFGALLPLAGTHPYGYTSSSITSTCGIPHATGLPTWSLQGMPYVPGPHGQAPPAYLPVLFSPSQGMIPAQPGWSTFTHLSRGGLSSLPSNDGSNLMSAHPLLQKPGDSGSTGKSRLSSIPSVNLPERPDEPECQYYMKTGMCKFGQACKYHHPKERNVVKRAVGTVGPLGLPLRPGEAVCTFYGMYGVCRYGPSCKFDHPVRGYYNYTLPSFSIPDPSATVPYLRSSPAMLYSSVPSAFQSGRRQPDRLMKSQDMSTKEKQQNPDLGTSPPSPEEHQSSSPSASSLGTVLATKLPQEPLD